MSDPGQFAQRVIRGLRNRGETRPIYFDEGRFALVFGEKGSENVWTADLKGIYKEFENTPDERHESIISHYAKVWMKERIVPKDYAVVRPRLGVSIRDSGHFEQHPGWVHWNLTSELSVSLVDDVGPALYDIAETSLSDWQVDKDACRQDALGNLRKSAWYLEKIGHVFRSRSNDSYDAARILFHEVIRTLPLKGAPVVLVPDRDCLVIAGADDVEGLSQLAATGHVRIEEGVRLISGTPWILRGSNWEEFESPDQTRAAFAHLTRLFDAINYGKQTRFLREQGEHRDDVFVADVEVFKTGPDRYETFSCLPSVGQTLLPRVDNVVLYDQQAETSQVTPWDDLFRVLVGRMLPVQRHPVRYRVESFPTLTERQRMGGTPRRLGESLASRLRSRPR